MMPAARYYYRISPTILLGLKVMDERMYYTILIHNQYQLGYLARGMAHQNVKVIGQKYLEHTERFRRMTQKQRISHIRQIFRVPSSGQYFMGKFPQYPNQSKWLYRQHQLQTYFWEPHHKPKAVIINYNALNAHGGLSGNMAQQLSKSGYVMASYDYPNFGKSGGQHRGHIQSFEQILEISEQFYQQVSNKYKDIPIFLAGVSMGGLMSFQIGLRALRNNISGCIFINPAFKDNPVNNPNLKQLIKRFAPRFPKFQLTKPLKNNSCIDSLQKYKLYDPYMYAGRLWTSTSANLLNHMDTIPMRFNDFNLPYLCIQGGTDKVLDPFVVFQLQKLSKCTDKQTVVIPEMWHALWFDRHLQQVVTMVQQWINQRT